MYKRTILLKNQDGLDESLAIEFTRKAIAFDAKIKVRAINANADANAKSIIMVTGLGLEQGQEIEVSAVGEDEIEAVDVLIDIIEKSTEEVVLR